MSIDSLDPTPRGTNPAPATPADRSEGTIVMPHDSDIGFVCDPEQYAVFASTLWEVARPRAGELDADEPVPATAGAGPAARIGADGATADTWAEWATDPDWEVS
jgi:hypothetical protein